MEDLKKQIMDKSEAEAKKCLVKFLLLTCTEYITVLFSCSISWSIIQRMHVLEWSVFMNSPAFVIDMI